MPEAQTVCMQELPLEPEISADPILRVSRDGKLDRGQMHADLMCAPRLQANLEQRMVAQELDRLEVRHGFPWLVGIEGALRRIAPVAAEGRVDPSASRTRTPLCQREVASVDFAVPDRLL